MAETTEVTQGQTQNQQPSVAELAAFAFNKPLQEQTSQAAATTTQTTDNSAQQTAITETTVQPVGIPDYNAFVKENFGIDDVESAKTEWKSLQEFRAKPPTLAEITFANEESKKIHQYLKEGKTKEVYAYLDAQERLGNLPSMDADQQLRLFYKMQNPLYDDEIIDLKLKKEYGFNEDDYKDEDGKITDHTGYRLAKADSAFKKQNDLQKAKDFFTQYQTKIELPDIQTPQTNVDEDYTAYKASNASADEAYNNVTVPGIKALKEADVSLKVSINDANNKMQFDINIVPEQTDFEAAKQDSLSLSQFLKKTCYDKDGKFVPQNLQRLVLLSNNFDKYGQSIARQAVNAERKRVIEQETAGNGMQRNFQTQVEPSEMDALKAFAFQKTG